MKQRRSGGQEELATKKHKTHKSKTPGQVRSADLSDSSHFCAFCAFSWLINL